MPTCTRRLRFCAGHRVYGHETKCQHLHGHNYVVLITVEAESLDDVGRVIDFGVVKQVMGRWLDDEWDHTTLLMRGDPLVDVLEEAEQRVVVLPSNPTAENIASVILERARALLGGMGVGVTRVRVWETENCYADAS